MQIKTHIQKTRRRSLSNFDPWAHVSLGFQGSSCASRRYFPSFFQNQTVQSRQFPFLQHFHQLLKAGGGKGTGRPAAVLANMSARVGSIGDNQIGGWHSYRASKTALNQRKSLPDKVSSKWVKQVDGKQDFSGGLLSTYLVSTCLSISEASRLHLVFCQLNPLLSCLLMYAEAIRWQSFSRIIPVPL